MNHEVFSIAFGDFNADKLTDAFAVPRNRSSLLIYFARDDEPLLQLGIKQDSKSLVRTV
jgi:hypothetical protein